MDLYNLKKNKLQEVKRVPFKLEKEIQKLIEENVENLFSLEFISSEFSVGGFRLDSLCFDNQTNSFVVIEYKKGSSYSVIDQGYSYMSIMLFKPLDLPNLFRFPTKTTLFLFPNFFSLAYSLSK